VRQINLPRPNEVKEYFKSLVSLCFLNGCDESFNELQLTSESDAILTEVALRWRVSLDFKDLSVLEASIHKSGNISPSQFEKLKSFDASALRQIDVILPINLA
jgi:hypothetical protein